jgi:hypothetical protein
MLDAFAHGEDVRIGSLHLIIDHDAAIDIEAGFVSEIDIRPDAGGNDDEVAIEDCPVLERDPFYAPIADNCRRRPAKQDADSKVLHLSQQISASIRIELPIHQRLHQMDDCDAAATDLQSARSLEAEQASADDHCSDAWARPFNELARIVQGSEYKNAISLQAVNRRHPRRAAGCQKQPVVRGHASVISGDRPVCGVDVDDPNAKTQCDGVTSIPVERIENDFIRVAFA